MGTDTQKRPAETISRPGRDGATLPHSITELTKTQATMLDAALGYARRGWAVLPLVPGGKKPSNPNGCSDATIDEARIRAWWTRRPSDNIGVNVGMSGLAVVDVDPRHGGDETWHALKQQHGLNDNTVTGLTGGGGTHLLYSANGLDPGALAVSLGPGVDIKRGNAYIVVWPSVHPDGPTYEWDIGAHPDDMAPLPLPPSLLLLLQKGGDGDRPKAAPPIGDRIPDGERDDTLTSLAGTMRRRGMAEAETLAALLVINEGRCDPPLPRSAVERIARSVARYDPAVKPGRETEKKKPLKRLTSREYHALYKQWGYDFRLNLCNDDVEVNGEPFSDTHAAGIRQQIRDYGIEEHRGTSVGATDDCIITQAMARCFHPIKDYFDSLRWDGEDHLARLLSHFTGDGYLVRWLDTWLPGAVARVYDRWQNPMLVLVSRQGLGKSYFAQWLCSSLPRLFVESPIVPEYKDHRLRLIQNFIWEVQELGATTRKADQDALKAFITLTWVKERKAYGKRELQKPVACSFIGTVNPDSGFLTDLTGNRRYIITGIETIDWGYSETMDVDQVWAQAVHVYRNGDAWKLTGKEQAQSERQNEKHLVVKPVQVYLERMYTVTDDDNDFVPVAEVLSRLNTEAEIRPHTGTAREVASVLRASGAIYARKRTKGVLERGYKRLKPITREIEV